MTTTEVINQLRYMTNAERLAIIESASRLVREQLEPVLDEREQHLAAAAAALLPDYLHDKELTALTALDGEDFCHA